MPGVPEGGRRAVPDGASRRWLAGDGTGKTPDWAPALLRLARGKTKRFASTAKSLGIKGVDQVTVERRLYLLLDAGLIEIHERRDRRGDFEPYGWRLTEAALALLDELDTRDDVSRLIERFLNDPVAGCDHPLVDAARRWLPSKGAGHPRASRILISIAEALSRGEWPTERGVSLAAFGDTKAVRVSAYPEVVGEVLGLPPEQVVRRPGQAVYAYGPFAFSVGRQRIGGDWSRPWIALTLETLDRMTGLTVAADRLLTVENLTPFEEEVRAGLPPRTIALYTGGFPGEPEIRLATMLLRAGVEQVAHWGDLDLGGLRIFRHLQRRLSSPVVPHRMSPDLLGRLPTAPLSPADRHGLTAWLEDDANPLRELAAALLEKNCKAEQEGWLLQRLEGITPRG